MSHVEGEDVARKGDAARMGIGLVIPCRKTEFAVSQSNFRFGKLDPQKFPKHVEGEDVAKERD